MKTKVKINYTDGSAMERYYPPERYTYRGLRTDLRKILSIWPCDDSTSVPGLGPQGKVQNLTRLSKNFVKAKNSLYLLCIIKFPFRIYQTMFYRGQFFAQW